MNTTETIIIAFMLFMGFNITILAGIVLGAVYVGMKRENNACNAAKA